MNILNLDQGSEAWWAFGGRASIAAGAPDDAANRAAASVYDKDQIVTTLDIAELKAEIAVLDARLRMIERILWGIVLAVIALLIRAYVIEAGRLALQRSREGEP